MKRVLKWVPWVVLLLCLSGGGWWVWCVQQGVGFHVFAPKKEKPVPDPERYEILVAELKHWREDLVEQYRKARIPDQKAAVEHDARIILEQILPEMMRCWRGTAYDFNGVAERPGKGKIACGYFVSTLIRDAGFKVNRYTLAQQASQNILLTFTAKENCQLRVGEPYSPYVDWVETLEPGIYLMGLDTHVGFVVIENDGMKFVHSSGMNKAGVVEETRDQAASIKWSNWRMLGHFTADPKVIRTWLAGENVKVVE